MSNSNEPTRQTTFLAGAMLGLSLMFMIQAYSGIDHDAALYLGESLRLRFPQILGLDPYFAHGSQGSYTVFPLVIAAVSTQADVATLFLWGTAVGMVCFAGASWLALRATLPKGERILSWLALLCLPTSYGAYRIFGYGEPFLTPRLYAEGLSLLAMALLARGRTPVGLGLLALAALLHPLQAIGAGLIVWLWLVLQDRRWLHALWSLPAVLMLAFAGIAPFDGLLKTVDPDTMRTAQSYSAHLFVTRWRLIDFQTVAFDVLVLGYAMRCAPPDWRSWARAGVVGIVIALTTSFLLADVMRLLLPTGLQLWRAHWLTHWLAMASVGWLLHRDLAARDLTRASLIALAVTLAYGRPGWAWMPAGLIYLAWPHLHLRLRPSLRRAVGIGAVFALLLFFFDYIGQMHQAYVDARRQLVMAPFDRAFFTYPALSLALVAGATAAWHASGRIGRITLIMCLLLPFAAYAGYRWDNRPALYKALEANPFRPNLFGIEIPEKAQVYWERASVVVNWLVINRADYYSPQQLSGLVFSPGAAREFSRRAERLKPLRMDVQKCLRPELTSEERRSCHMSSAALHHACAPDPESPPPDYMILPYHQSVRSLGSWTIHDPAAKDPQLTYWLYSCNDVTAEK